MRKKKVCIISPAVYPLLKKSKKIQTAGGAEAQLLTLGSGLHEKGFDVHYIVDDFGQKTVEIIRGVAAQKVPLRYMGGKNRHIVVDWARLLLVLKRIHADVHLIKLPRNLLLPVGLFSRLFRKKLIFIGQIDNDVDPEFIKKNENLYSYLFFKAGLAFVDFIVAQNENQKAGFAKAFGKRSRVIKSFLTLPEAEGKTDKGYVLWVGNDLPKKQPHFFVELAKQLPQYRFKMIMSRTGYQFSLPIIEQAGQVPNLEFLGFVPFSEIHEHFQKASLFVSTSKREGFPNTFLQSWQYETPVVSLSVNPDSVIDRFELGEVCCTFDRLCEQVDQLMHDESERCRRGGNGKKYVNQNHSVEIVLEQYLSVFNELGV
jgi:glycosyltransferase involved in cell wall biosynthesis